MLDHSVTLAQDQVAFCLLSLYQVLPLLGEVFALPEGGAYWGAA